MQSCFCFQLDPMQISPARAQSLSIFGPVQRTKRQTIYQGEAEPLFVCLSVSSFFHIVFEELLLLLSARFWCVLVWCRSSDLSTVIAAIIIVLLRISIIQVCWYSRVCTVSTRKNVVLCLRLLSAIFFSCTTTLTSALVGSQILSYR